MIRFFIYVLFLSSSLQNALAQPNEHGFRPAQLTDLRSSLQNRIKFPEVSGNVNKTYLCEAVVRKSGDVGQIYCFNIEEDDIPFFEGISGKNTFIDILPAKYNGKTEGVWFHFSVNFQKIGVREIVQVIPNHGHNRDQYGLDYSAAQLLAFERYLTNSEWSLYRNSCPEGYEYFIETIVGDDGRPESSRILYSSGYPNCEDYVIDWLNSANYVPAFHRGAPVRSKSVTHFNGYLKGMRALR